MVCILRFVRSPLAPLKKGGKYILLPLFKGDLGGSKRLVTNQGTSQTSSNTQIVQSYPSLVID